MKYFQISIFQWPEFRENSGNALEFCWWFWKRSRKVLDFEVLENYYNTYGKSLNSWKMVACCCISQDTYMNFVVGASQLFLVSETNIEKKVAKYVVFCFMQRNYFQCLLLLQSHPGKSSPRLFPPSCRTTSKTLPPLDT